MPFPVPATIGPTTVICHEQAAVTTRFYDGMILMLVARQGQFYEFNESGTRLWQLAVQPVNVQQLCAQFEETYDVDPQQCQLDVASFVARLIELDILKVCPVAHLSS